VFLNPDAYDAGFGVGGSFVGEAYVAGAMPGVIIFSLLLGLGLNLLYRSCSTHMGLFFSALILPSVFWMIRGEIFDWVPALIRGSFLVLILYVGWRLYILCIELFSVRLKVRERVTGRRT